MFTHNLKVTNYSIRDINITLVITYHLRMTIIYNFKIVTYNLRVINYKIKSSLTVLFNHL